MELHCHTKMSDMDGVSEVEDIIKRAKSWGHKAIAVTDHGVVQAYPAASHSLEKGDNFKVIYGVEGYLVDDLKDIVTDAAGQSLDDAYVVFDIETTGFSAENDRIIEIGAVRVEQGEITDKFSVFVNPQTPIPFEIEKLTGINDEMVMNEPTIEEILPKFLDFCKGAVMVAHNAGFDMSFIRKNSERQGLPCEFTVVDTVALARILLAPAEPFQAGHSGESPECVSGKSSSGRGRRRLYRGNFREVCADAERAGYFRPERRQPDEYPGRGCH